MLWSGRQRELGDILYVWTLISGRLLLLAWISRAAQDTPICGPVGTLPKAALWGEKWHMLSLQHGVCPSEGIREVFISGPRARKNFCESALFLACGQRTLFALAVRKLSSKSVRASSGVACTLGSNPAPPPFLVAWISLLRWFSLSSGLL